MIKITSFCALIVGLLLAMPLIFTEAEAEHASPNRGETIVKADRLASDRLAIAFETVSDCDQSEDASSTCPAIHGLGAVRQQLTELTTVERRDEARQASTLVLTERPVMTGE